MTPLHSINRPYVALELICFSDQRIRQGKERCFGCVKRTAFSISLCVVTVLFGSQFLSAATEEKKQWPQYVSKDGGFEFAAAGEVKESSPARGIRQVRAVVDMGGDGSYQAIAGFFPVSLGSRDDAEKEFSTLKASERSLCAEEHFEKTEVQGLPARVLHGTKCGNSHDTNWLGIWVFAGNRSFNFEIFTSPLFEKREVTKRILASFKITDPRFVGPGEWTAFDCVEGGFSVSLPGFPAHQTQPVPGAPDKTIYTLSNYTLVASSFSAAPGKPGDLLSNAVKGVEKSYQIAVTDRTDLTYEGLPATILKFDFQNPNGRFHQSAFILVGKEHDYILAVTRSVDKPMEQSDLDRFFRSFHEIKAQH